MSDGGGGKKVGGAGYQKGGQYRKQAYNNNATGAEVFAGSCAKLKGSILDCGQPHHAESHSKSLEAITNHVRVNFREGVYVARTIAMETLVPVPRPVAVLGDDGAASTDVMDVAILNSEIKNYVSRKVTYVTSLGQAYGLVWGQCTPNMRANLEALTSFNDMKSKEDLLELLKSIKSRVFNFDQNKSLPDALISATDALAKFHQSETMRDEVFLEKYKSYYEVLTHSGGRLGDIQQ